MSKKNDLLVRVRYENPLPPPPFPPKLLDIPTSLSRYAKPSYTAAMIRETPFPMMVDAECGMPLDLLTYPGIWTGHGREEINPRGPAPDLHPTDAALLQPPEAFLSPNDPSQSADVTGHVSWLRKTEYIQNKDKSTSSALKTFKRPEQLDRSMAGQLRLVEKSFEGLKPSDIHTLVHPEKPTLKAVEFYDVMPDEDSWPNGYSLLKFNEAPSKEEAHREDVNPQFSTAIFRPVTSHYGTILHYYLPKDDQTALDVAKHMDTSAEEFPEPFPYTFSRQYELSENREQKNVELAFVISEDPNADEDAEEGAADVEGAESSSMGASGGKGKGKARADDGRKKRPKGAFYREFDHRHILKKRRFNRNEDTSHIWDDITIQINTPPSDEIASRAEQREIVADPDWVSKHIAEEQEKATQQARAMSEEVEVPPLARSDEGRGSGDEAGGRDGKESEDDS